MTVSNSIAFSLSGEQLVREARALIGVDASEEPLSADELSQGLTSLNMMLRTWQADGIMEWTMAEGSLSLTEGKFAYTFGAGGDFAIKPFDLAQVRINRAGNDLEMFELERSDYYRIPKKDSKGYPTQWYYDRQRDGGTLNIWPSPDAQTGTLNFTYRRYIMDMVDGTNTFDLPPEWYEAVIYNLARRMIPRYGTIDPVTAAHVKETADMTYATLNKFDVGEGIGSIRITPDYIGSR